MPNINMGKNLETIPSSHIIHLPICLFSLRFPPTVRWNRPWAHLNKSRKLFFGFNLLGVIFLIPGITSVDPNVYHVWFLQPRFHIWWRFQMALDERLLVPGWNGTLICVSAGTRLFVFSLWTCVSDGSHPKYLSVQMCTRLQRKRYPLGMLLESKQ